MLEVPLAGGTHARDGLAHPPGAMSKAYASDPQKKVELIFSLSEATDVTDRSGPARKLAAVSPDDLS